MSEAAEIKPQINLNFSNPCGKLAEALAKATLEFKPVVKGNKNPFFRSKYADLTTLIDATREALAQHGLVVVQFLGQVSEGQVEISTMLFHSSGEWLRSQTTMPCAKPDAQGVGSAVTYGRRYAYGAMLSLGAEDDDDGNAAVGSRNEEIKADLDEKMSKQERIGQFQVKALVDACEKTKKSIIEQDAYLEKLSLKQWEELTKQDFQAALKWANNALKLPARASGEPTGDTKLMARVFATAAERGIPADDVKEYAHSTHKVLSMTSLTKPQLQDVLEWVQQV